MKKEKQNKKGFTLIEVLVVVLIVGILTSIAMPQYQVAVMKSRFAKVQQAAKQYIDASYAYYAHYNAYPDSFEGMDISSFGSTTNPREAGECTVGSDIYCCLMREMGNYQSGGIACGTKDYKIGFQFWWYDTDTNKSYCVAKNDNGAALKACKSLGTYYTTLNFPSPEGHRGTYEYYRLK